MSTYIHFTDQQKEQARQTDLVSLLKLQGEPVKRSGSEYEWRDGTQKVTVCGNLWFHQYERVGGDAVDFVRKFYDKSYPEAVEYLLVNSNGTRIASSAVVKERKPFELPLKNDNMRRAYTYLLSRRKIDKNVLDAFVCRQMIYESETYHNVVFVGYDTSGIPRHANMRGTGAERVYKGNAPGSQPEYSFHWTGTSRYLYLFEAPIDMLSFLSLRKENWKNHSYAACCGVSDYVLWQMIKDYPSIKYVYLCLDSDQPGQAAAHRMQSRLSEKGIQSEILVPIHKDWNDDLRAVCETPRNSAAFSCSNKKDEGEGENPCQALGHLS